MSDNGKKHSISRESLLKMLSGSSVLNSIAPKAAANGTVEKENVPIGYQQTNKIMVQQIRQLKLEVTTGKRQIEDLRKENFRLSERLHALESATESERMEMVLNERLKKKLGQLVQISKRCIETMERHKEDFSNVLNDIGIDELDFGENSKTKLPQAPRMMMGNYLDRVEESPIKFVEVTTTTAVSTVRRGRPPKKTVKEEPFDPEATPKAQKVEPSPSTIKRSKGMPLETPKVLPRSAKKRKVETDLETPRHVIRGSNDGMLPPETPLDFPNPFVETDTVRRRRQATLRVNNYALPALNTKMRRPGKSEESNPYIS